MKSWKTTLAGAGILLAALGKVASEISGGTPIDFTSLLSMVMAAIGLFAAKDANVTGGTIKQ